ncbi:hypothetical protein DL768_009139 [Monosporascus sp. mg162]|nr:hypothetical protein DL768_009139 [Monosporascus sp. mg162]
MGLKKSKMQDHDALPAPFDPIYAMRENNSLHVGAAWALDDVTEVLRVDSPPLTVTVRTWVVVSLPAVTVTVLVPSLILPVRVDDVGAAVVPGGVGPAVRVGSAGAPVEGPSSPGLGVALTGAGLLVPTPRAVASMGISSCDLMAAFWTSTSPPANLMLPAGPPAGARSSISAQLV